MVACVTCIPADSVSCLKSSAVNTVPLSVKMCFGTYACFMKIDKSALTTDSVSGLHIGTANKYRVKTSTAVRMCVNPFDAGKGPFKSISNMSSGPSQGS